MQSEPNTLNLARGDITKQTVDAVVNAANSSLMGGGGVDGAIHRAGGPAILEACREIVAKIGRLSTGEAVITAGGNLPAEHVVHTVGPIWNGGNRNEDSLLTNCYRNSLKVAAENKCETIAFPSISTGAYCFPVERAADMALRTILTEAPQYGYREIQFVLFSESDLQVYEKALADIVSSIP